jgi:DNA polymerase-1
VTESPLAHAQLHLVTSIADVLACREWAGQRRDTPLGVDVESEGLQPLTDKLRLLQLGDKHHGWAFPATWAGAALEIIAEYDGSFVCHNAVFDRRVISHSLSYQIPWHKIHDTMILAALYDPVRPKGLKPLAARLIDRNATAGEHLLHDGMKLNGWTWATVPHTFPPYWSYAALDPVLTAMIYDVIASPVLESSPEAYDLERAVTPILGGMMDAGLLIDEEYTTIALRKLQRYISGARTWLKDVYGVTSLMSARQLKDAFGQAGLPITRVTRTGLPAIDKELLESIKVMLPETDRAQQLATVVLKARHAEKLAGTYLSSFLELAKHDGSIHCSIRQLEARTGRSSCAEPNLQNLPRTDRIARGSFIPRPGCAFISVDAAQIELRIAAHISGDGSLITAIREADASGNDIYATMATMLFGHTVTKSDPQRQSTKSSAYAKLYGSGIRTLARTLGLPEDAARNMSNQFNQRFPRLGMHAGELTAHAEKQIASGDVPHTRTDTGRYLPCDPDRVYTLFNYAVQATAAEELKRAMVRLASAGFGDMMRLPVHDEIILECPVDDADEILSTVLDVVREDDRYKVSVPWDGTVMPERWAKG